MRGYESQRSLTGRQMSLWQILKEEKFTFYFCHGGIMIKLLKTLLLLATSLDPCNLSARESDKVIAVFKLKKLGVAINTTHTSYSRAWPNSKRSSPSSRKSMAKFKKPTTTHKTTPCRMRLFKYLLQMNWIFTIFHQKR